MAVLPVARPVNRMRAFGQTGSQLTEPPQRRHRAGSRTRSPRPGRARTRPHATEPRDLWVSGSSTTVRPWAQVERARSGAHTRTRRQAVLGSLAVGCLVPMRARSRRSAMPPTASPTGPRATTTTASGAAPRQPRARCATIPAAMIAFLEEAATRPRFDDYQSRGALAVVGGGDARCRARLDPAARASSRRPTPSREGPMRCRRCSVLCSDASRLPTTSAARAQAPAPPLAQRGALVLAHRRCAPRGGRASAGAAYASAQQRVIDLQRRAFECAEAGNAVRAGIRVRRRGGARTRGRAMGSAARAGGARRRSGGLRTKG
jgi:hypothetical protein